MSSVGEGRRRDQRAGMKLSVSTGSQVSGYQSRLAWRAMTSLEKHDIRGRTVLRIAHRGLIGHDADPQPCHEILGSLTRDERIDIGIGGLNDPLVKLSQLSPVVDRDPDALPPDFDQ
jgi:hypothetical protein